MTEYASVAVECVRAAVVEKKQGISTSLSKAAPPHYTDTQAITQIKNTFL